MLGVADSWIFSAQLMLGLMAENHASLPLLVPSFFSLVSAVVFAPVRETLLPFLLHRRRR